MDGQKVHKSKLSILDCTFGGIVQLLRRAFQLFRQSVQLLCHGIPQELMEDFDLAGLEETSQREYACFVLYPWLEIMWVVKLQIDVIDGRNNTPSSFTGGAPFITWQTPEPVSAISIICFVNTQIWDWLQYDMLDLQSEWAVNGLELMAKHMRTQPTSSNSNSTSTRFAYW